MPSGISFVSFAAATSFRRALFTGGLSFARVACKLMGLTSTPRVVPQIATIAAVKLAARFSKAMFQPFKKPHATSLHGALFSPSDTLIPHLHFIPPQLALENTTETPPRVLSPEWFSPIGPDGSMHRSPDTRAIHWYAMGGSSLSRRIARWMSWHGMDWLVRRVTGRRKI